MSVGSSGQIGERHQAVEVIRAALPAFTAAAQPGALRAEVGPELVEMPAKSGSLNFKLLVKPAGRLHGTERQEPIGALLQRRTIRNRMHVGGKYNGRKQNTVMKRIMSCR